MSKPPLDLSVVVRAPDGYEARWGSEELEAGSRLSGLSFGTQRMQGFANASLSLPRRMDRDYPDLSLAHDVRIVGATGDVAYEGMVAEMPRSLEQDGHSLGVTLTGHMGQLGLRTFTEIFIDRDMSIWSEPALQRTLDLRGAGVGAVTGPSVVVDDNGATTVITQFMGAWSQQVRCEAWYDAGLGNEIGHLYYTFTQGHEVDYTNGSWSWQALVCADQTATLATRDATGELSSSAGPTAGVLDATAAGRRYGLLMFGHNAAVPPAGTQGVQYPLLWSDLAVVGTHGLVRHTVEDGHAAGGVRASDVIRYLARKHAPQLDTTGVADSSYAIPHLVFREPTKPYDAMLAANAYELWDLAVWESKRLHYAPVVLTDHDWEIRLDEPGVTAQFHGPSLQEVANGIVIRFTNLATGKPEVLTPDTDRQLLDESLENVFNQRGLQSWPEITLSEPTTREAALHVGRVALMERRRAKSPGSMSVQGHIRDRQGNWQPVWKVRAGDRVAITSSSSRTDGVRVIQETTYQHDSRTVSLSLDTTARTLPALMNRLAVRSTAS